MPIRVKRPARTSKLGKRKKGNLRRELRRIAWEFARDGKITPLEVMMDNMRFFHGRGEELLNRLMDATASKEMDEEQMRQVAIDMIAMKRNAQECAVDAAPYLHARLNPIEDTGSNGGSITINVVSSDLLNQDQSTRAVGPTIQSKKYIDIQPETVEGD